MSHVLEAIRERRSIRKYQPRSVSKKLIEEVLVAAGWAPSAHNAQPYRFIVISDGALKRQLAEAMAEAWAIDITRDGLMIDSAAMRSKVDRFSTAPALILGCLSMNGMIRFRDGRRQKVERDLAMQSLGAAVQNLLLAAHAKGLGGCWFCAPAFCRETVRKMLSIPDDVEPEALVVLGYPSEKPPVPIRKELDDFCFRNGWGQRLN